MRPLPVENGQLQNITGVKQRTATRARAIAAIQGGKYVKALSPEERFASDEFAIQKQVEQTLEERRWSA